MINKRDKRAARRVVKYLERFIGLPYKWGGNDPMEGFDCSNLVVEGLKSEGIIDHNEFINSDGLYKRFGNQKVMLPQVGVLAFFGKWIDATVLDITHVGICLDNKRMLEAAGGKRNMSTVSQASEYNAFTKIRPIVRRTDFIGFLDPFQY